METRRSYAGKGLCAVLLGVLDGGVEVPPDVVRHCDAFEKLAKLGFCGLAEAASEVVGHDHHEPLHGVFEHLLG